MSQKPHVIAGDAWSVALLHELVDKANRKPAVLNATESRSELRSVSSRVSRKRHYARLSSSEGAILATTALRRAANHDAEAV
jgi:hypothetical protein